MTTQNITNTQKPIPFCQIVLSANQSIAASTTTILQFNFAVIDNASSFNTGSFQFLPILPNLAWYYFSANIVYTNNTGSYTVNSFFSKNSTSTQGAQSIQGTFVSGNISSFTCGSLISLNGTTDFVNVKILSGAAITVLGGSTSQSVLNVFYIPQ
jgi:hypothetical protein